MEDPVGFAPTTYRVRAGCSTGLNYESMKWSAVRYLQPLETSLEDWRLSTLPYDALKVAADSGIAPDPSVFQIEVHLVMSAVVLTVGVAPATYPLSTGCST